MQALEGFASVGARSQYGKPPSALHAHRTSGAAQACKKLTIGSKSPLKCLSVCIPLDGELCTRCYRSDCSDLYNSNML